MTMQLTEGRNRNEQMSPVAVGTSLDRQFLNVCSQLPSDDSVLAEAPNVMGLEFGCLYLLKKKNLAFLEIFFFQT